VIPPKPPELPQADTGKPRLGPIGVDRQMTTGLWNPGVTPGLTQLGRVGGNMLGDPSMVPMAPAGGGGIGAPPSAAPQRAPTSAGIITPPGRPIAPPRGGAGMMAPAILPPPMSPEMQQRLRQQQASLAQALFGREYGNQ
jgi:hypothetical protein